MGFTGTVEKAEKPVAVEAVTRTLAAGTIVKINGYPVRLVEDVVVETTAENWLLIQPAAPAEAGVE